MGRFKAKFFAAFGYTPENWRQFEADIRRLAQSHDAKKGNPTVYGRKYEVRGIIKGPNGKSFEIVTVWVILKGENIPRFITAHPGEKP